MRPTISVDDVLFEAVQKYAKSREINFSKAAPELVRRGLHAPVRTRVVNGFAVVDLSAGSPPVSSADVKRLRDV